MKKKLISITITLAAITCMAEAGTTVENLNYAYRRESNAAKRYRQFAVKADSENLKQAAKLFRAAAASEEIHRKLIERTLSKTGGQVDTFKLGRITLGSTADNLRSAIQEVTAESGTTYPGFLAPAKDDREKSAIRAFNYTLESDKKLANHFQQALDQIGSEALITCYVCGDCGLLVTRLPKKKCPVCHEGLKEFNIIN